MLLKPYQRLIKSCKKCVCVLEVTDRKTSRGILLFYVIKCNHLTSNTYCPSNQWNLFTRNSNKMQAPDLVHDVLQQTPAPNRKGDTIIFHTENTGIR